jgi:hypothetical protein
LEGIIDFQPEAAPIFENEQPRAQAIDRFRRIIAHFEQVQPASCEGYNRPALVRLTFEYARSPESQDKALKAFFQSLALGMLDDNDGIDIDLADDLEVARLRTLVFSFADHLIYHFFLPCMSASLDSPQLSFPNG